MERLFYFFYHNRAFFTFFFLEIACIWMVIENNHYQSARFFNSSNTLVAGMNRISQDIRDYFLLRNINTTLALENAELRRQLEHYRQLQYDTTGNTYDSTMVRKFEFISAKVVNNSVDRFTNYITINKGADDGIETGMAVISPLGAVGKVRAVSSHYSVVTSLLHRDYRISAALARTGHFGSVNWSGRDADYVKLEFIPSHVELKIGDTVVTSGYNAIFPEGIMIGRIESYAEQEDETVFWDIDVKLSQDFRKLSYVEVVKSRLSHEQDSLEQVTIELLER